MDQISLFDREMPQPLAAKLRPENLEEYVGQSHLLGKGKVLRRLIEQDQVSSMIFWGPPGVGKTTLARIIANKTKSSFIDFSAVTSGIKEIRTVMEQAEKNRQYGIKTILFVDEIHRFNKAQQDAFLPFVEKGSIILIGATTENPSFEINSALLSRCKVFVLQALTAEEIKELLVRALQSPKGFGGQKVIMDDALLEMLAVFANGDARNALSTLEMVVLNGEMDAEGAVTVTRRRWNSALPGNPFCMTKKGRSIIILSPPCISPCAIQILTRQSTGLRGCWRQGKIRSMWQDEWYALPAKMWGWRIRGLCRLRWQRIRHVIFWGCRSVTCI